MREIKFRAWMEDANQDWLEEDSEDRYEMIYDFAYEEYETINDMLRKTDNLMQYTGLKDKNGVEIYCGDILEYCGHFGVVSFDINFGRYFAEHSQCYIRADTFKKCNIIGNIYENKELLNED